MVSSGSSDDTKAGNSAQGRNRRRNPRYSCEGSAECMASHPECLFRGQIVDISQNGCFIVTRARSRLGPESVIDLRFKLNNCPYRARARVVAIRPDGGVAVEFTFPSAEAEDVFKTLISTLSLGVLPE